MNEIKISFDSCGNRSKPDIYNTRSIKERVAEKIHRLNQSNLKSFVTRVGKDGCTFSPATFKTTFEDITINRENFLQMQLFALNFNGKILFDEVMSRAKQYGLSVLFAYETFSSKNQDRFRVVFLNDVSIEYVKVAEIMVEALLTIFPEADSRSKDLTQIYFGGKQLLYFDDSVPTINICWLIMNMCLYLRDRYGDNHKRYIYEFSAQMGLELTNRKMLDVSVIEITKDLSRTLIESLSPTSNIYIIENGDKSSLKSQEDVRLKNYYVINGSKYSAFTTLLSTKKSKEIHLKHRSDTLDKLGSDCQLCREFRDATHILSKDELFNLATNITQVESGSDWFIQILRKYSYFGEANEKHKNWDYYLSYMKKTECQPASCNSFCPYKHYCHHARDMLSTVKTKQHSVRKLANFDNTNFYDVDEAMLDFKERLTTAIESNDTNIHALKSSTGIGKSTAVLEMMEVNAQLKYLFAFSTNELKNEKYEVAVKMGIKAVRSPSLLEYKDKLPKKVWEHIECLYRVGQPHAVNNYINELISKREVDKSCLTILRKYQKDMADFYASECHVFTTHSRLFTLDYWYLKKFNAVIFDEDPILNCIIPNQVEIPISKLHKVLAEIDQDSHLAKKIKSADKAVEKETFFTLSRINYDNTYDAISAPIDIASFCLAEKFLYKKKSDENNIWENNMSEDSIVFFKPFQLQRRIKYIILSATVNKSICNYCFGLTHKVTFYNCIQARHKGILEQYPELPTSRAYLDRNSGLLKDLIKFSGFDDIITFKKYGIGKYYIGKTTGIDVLKGKDLTVAATPHQPTWLYKLFAYTVGCERLFDINAKMRYQAVRYNGFSFWFMTFNNDNEILRKIQFWIIESELLQAVGRARLTREECKVNVFSNFPLLQANEQKLPKHILDKYVVNKE